MRKNKLLLLLALLLTAATGAWATDVYVVGNGSDGNWLNGVAWDPGAAANKMTEQNGVYSITYKDVDANSDLQFKFAINGSWDVNYGCTSWDANELNKTLSNIEAGGANFKFGLTEKADVTISFNLSEMTYMISTKGMKVGDDAATGYTVSLKDGVKDADKWTVKVGEGQAQALPIGGLKGDGSETVTLKYTGRLKVKGVKATSDAEPAGKTVDLSTLTADYEAKDGETLTGTLASNVKISIADGATVKLKDATINGGDDYSYKWAGLNCAGDATITLEGTNMVKGFYNEYPGIYVPSGKTLTIQGTGSLNARSNGYAAGIGGGYKIACGNITISGGTVEATGGDLAAGIGGGNSASCGNITINGGTITATGGKHGPGIGGGKSASCGNITIANTVTKVTATKGAEAPHSIGKGTNGTCGTVTIGGTKYWENNAAVNGGDTYLAQATIEYPAAAKEPATVTTAPTGAAIVGVGKTTELVSGGVADGGTLWYAVTTTNTKPASTDGFSATVPTAETITASGKVYVWYYVKGDDTHSDSEIAGPVSVTVTPALSLTNPVVGQVIGSDGKNYAAASVPSGVTKVAMIAYVSGSNGLAIALADEGSLNWKTAKSTCEAKTPAFTGGTWHLPTQAEWNQMFSANGGDEESYTGLNTKINTAGGTTLQSGFYWSSSEYSPGVGAHLVHLDDGDADWSKANETLVRKVRACLAF